MSRFSKNTCPEIGSTILSILFPRVVFPDPLSPAKPKISPSLTVKLTSSVACTNCVLLKKEKRPVLTGK